ncbi:hypothetical protein BH09PLA1_BH09PLA1_22410 [soil metagenome]
MGICFGSLFLIVSGIVLMISMLRWFEQTRDAVDDRNWSRLMLLVIAPPSVWMFPTRVPAGRPIPIAKFEPVRGFGALPKGGIVGPSPDASTPPPLAARHAVREKSDQPPPGTPPEFLGMPKIPPKKPPRAIDPEKLEKLRQKMKEQGMLPDE